MPTETKKEEARTALQHAAPESVGELLILADALRIYDEHPELRDSAVQHTTGKLLPDLLARYGDVALAIIMTDVPGANDILGHELRDLLVAPETAYEAHERLRGGDSDTSDTTP